MADRHLLVIDVGNSQTTFGLYDLDAAGVTAEDGLIDHWKVSTELGRTDDELAGIVGSFFRLARIDPSASGQKTKSAQCTRSLSPRSGCHRNGNIIGTLPGVWCLPRGARTPIDPCACVMFRE